MLVDLRVRASSASAGLDRVRTSIDAKCCNKPAFCDGVFGRYTRFCLVLLMDAATPLEIAMIALWSLLTSDDTNGTVQLRVGTDTRSSRLTLRVGWSLADNLSEARTLNDVVIA